MIGELCAVNGARDDDRPRVSRQLGEGGDAVGEVTPPRKAVAEPEDATGVGFGDVSRDRKRRKVGEAVGSWGLSPIDYCVPPQVPIWLILLGFANLTTWLDPAAGILVSFLHRKK